MVAGRNARLSRHADFRPPDPAGDFWSDFRYNTARFRPIQPGRRDEAESRIISFPLDKM
jgi:hypothetical protein